MRHFALSLWTVAALCGACAASLERAEPERELTVVAVSSSRDEAAAKEVARGRALERAAKIGHPGGMAFSLAKSRAKPRLKLMSRGVSLGLTPEIEVRKPSGARATIKLTRPDNALADLAALRIVRASAQASGLDLAVAQDRADRAVFCDAILRAAAALRKTDATLYGVLRVVNYHAADEGETVRVTADVSVTFGDDSVVREQTQQTHVNEELEEVEPPEEAS